MDLNVYLTNFNMSNVIIEENNKVIIEYYRWAKTYFSNWGKKVAEPKPQADSNNDKLQLMTITSNQKPKTQESNVSVSNFDSTELQTMSTIIIGRHLGNILGNYSLAQLSYQKMDVAYNVLLNSCNHLVFWSLDKTLISFLCRIPVISPYQDQLLSLVSSGRYGFITYKTVSNTINNEDYQKKSLSGKCKELGIDIGFLASKMGETYLIYKLEQHLCKTGNWLLNLGLVITFHYGYTKLENMLKQNQDIKINLDNNILNKKLTEYKSALYELKSEL